MNDYIWVNSGELFPVIQKFLIYIQMHAFSNNIQLMSSMWDQSNKIFINKIKLLFLDGVKFFLIGIFYFHKRKVNLKSDDTSGI